MNGFKVAEESWTAVRSDPAEGVDCWWICAGDGNREKEIATVYGGVGSHEAYARLIAAAPALLEALAGLEFFYAREGENNVDRFERVAERFYRETGIMAPGKDASPLSSQPDRDERNRAYDAWVDARVNAARAALSRALSTEEKKP